MVAPAAYPDGTGVGHEHPVDELEDGAFSSTAAADERNSLAACDRETDRAQHVGRAAARRHGVEGNLDGTSILHRWTVAQRARGLPQRGPGGSYGQREDDFASPARSERALALRSGDRRAPRSRAQRSHHRSRAIGHPRIFPATIAMTTRSRNGASRHSAPTAVTPNPRSANDERCALALDLVV